MADPNRTAMDKFAELYQQFGNWQQIRDNSVLPSQQSASAGGGTRPHEGHNSCGVSRETMTRVVCGHGHHRSPTFVDTARQTVGEAAWTQQTARPVHDYRAIGKDD